MYAYVYGYAYERGGLLFAEEEAQYQVGLQVRGDPYAGSHESSARLRGALEVADDVDSSPQPANADSALATAYCLLGVGARDLHLPPMSLAWPVSRSTQAAKCAGWPRKPTGFPYP